MRLTFSGLAGHSLVAFKGFVFDKRRDTLGPLLIDGSGEVSRLKKYAQIDQSRAKQEIVAKDFSLASMFVCLFVWCSPITVLFSLMRLTD